MREKLNLDDRNLSSLAIAGAIVSLFLIAFGAHSVMRFKTLSGRSALSRSTVVMKIIQHGVKSVCPKCGARGIPICPECSVEMYWNGYQGRCVCPACGKGGFPQCQRCKAFMTWIEAKGR